MPTDPLVEELPSYDPYDLWPGYGAGWEPLEPEWDRGYYQWCRDYWRRTAPVPFKKRRYGR